MNEYEYTAVRSLREVWRSFIGNNVAGVAVVHYFRAAVHLHVIMSRHALSEGARGCVQVYAVNVTIRITKKSTQVCRCWYTLRP